MSASVEDYLAAIYRLTPEGKAVGPTRLAEFMGLSAPSISVMVKRLTDQGLVVKDNGRGVALSPDGETRALVILRKHRLAERFLVDKLGIDWATAHIEAHRFEHALSDTVADALERFLGHPTTCPHGQPIPDARLEVPTSRAVPLAELGVGDDAVLARVADDEPDMLRWLARVGLIPGARLRVEQVDPSGAFLLRVGDERVAAGVDVVRHILVNPQEPSDV
jgi:DtxR family Mn-dependent transcriptional regulator